jgi:hypothetical protein
LHLEKDSGDLKQLGLGSMDKSILRHKYDGALDRHRSTDQNSQPEGSHSLTGHLYQSADLVATYSTILG